MMTQLIQQQNKMLTELQAQIMDLKKEVQSVKKDQGLTSEKP